MILVNGLFASHIDAMDRGFLYGDGLFETLAVRNHQAQYWPQHLQRLQHGCSRLQIACPDASQLQSEVEQLCSLQADAVLKIIISRGGGGRGYRPDPNALATRVLSLHPWPAYPNEYQERGVRVRLCTTRLAVQPSLAGIKHLNRLEQVLARQEWDEVDIAEGLMLDSNDNVIEGTMSNIFMVQDGTLYTPNLDRCGIAGVVRGQVLEHARRMKIPTCITQLSESSLHQADELFLTNSIIGIWPIRDFADTVFTPGPLTRKFSHLAPISSSPLGPR